MIEHMKMKKGGLKYLAALFGAVLMVAPVEAANKPTPMKVGQTVSMELEPEGTTDYSVALGKGAWRIVWDAERTDGQRGNLIGSIALLKINGAVVESRLVSMNELAVNARVGETYRTVKPTVARLRIKNGYGISKMWLTIVPLAQKTRVPWGWGAAVTPARISADNGVGGELAPNAVVFHSITLPKGKWSLSLGLARLDKVSGNLIGGVDVLDPQGFTTKAGLINMNEISDQARVEGIMTVTKPTPILLRVSSHNGNAAYTYDITIAPADE